MSFCKGCGSEVQDELNLCPYCGTKIVKKIKPSESITVSGDDSVKVKKNETKEKLFDFDEMPVYRKNVTLMVIVTVLTCGLAGILFWQPCISNDMNKLTRNKGVNGSKCLLLTILTCGWYHYIWHYKMGQRLQEIDYSGKDRGLLFVLSAALGFWWINNILIQNAINNKAEYSSY
jgi:DNA-directed RNA polymerase subunit RPC12/RpoP